MPICYDDWKNYTYFIAHHYKFIENRNIEEGTLLITSDPIFYHLEKSGVDSFEKLERSLIHIFWRGVGEDIEDEEDEIEEDEVSIETNYTNGNNVVVKLFNQKCVICLERDSVYAFRQGGRQCICEECYENKDNIYILYCVVCRT